MMKGWQHTGAFVIWLRAGAEVEAGRFDGRVEHVASNQTADFHSTEELLAFLARVQKEASANQQQPTAMLLEQRQPALDKIKGD